MDREHGFTLSQTLVTLAVLAALSALAVPKFAGARSSAHTARAHAALLGSISAAGRESTLRSQEVVLCPAAGGGAVCSPGTNWSQGWTVFVDRDADRQFTAADRLVESIDALPPDVSLLTTEGRTRLIFQPTGSNAGSNVTFTLCDRRGAGRASALVLANDGRLRAARPTSAAARRCVSSLRP